MIFKLILLLLLLALISIPTVLQLWKKKHKKEAAFYVSLMGIAALVGALTVSEIEIPTPSDPLRSLFKPIGEKIFHTSDNNKLHQE